MQRFHRPADTSAVRPRAAGAPRTRAAVAAAALLVICGAPFAGAATGDNLREGVRNGTTTKETEIIANIRTTTAAKGGFAMRMSNLSSTGGGFVNGCRASAAATSKPCYRASNLSTGRAFEFNSNNGAIVGTITAGAGGDTKRPFTTNATGVATGLNADRVDNLHASEIIAAARTKAGLAAATADNAANADTLDGKDSSEFVAAADVAALIPVAVVNIAADGTLRSSSHRTPVTGTPVVSHTPGSNIYDIDLPGVQFFFSDDAANCTAADGTSKIASVNSIGGNDVRVFVTTDAGAATEGALYCSIYNLR